MFNTIPMRDGNRVFDTVLIRVGKRAYVLDY